MRRLFAMLVIFVMLAGCAATSAPSATHQGLSQNTQPTQSGVTQPTTEEMPNSFSGLGSKMPELTVTCADGQTRSVSELLKEKELVVLNFWFEDCAWCLKEFPVMELTYQKYKENVEILALNPSDGAESVKAFAQKYGMTVPMAACNPMLPRNCGVTAYPTSIFIDRYGVVCLIHVGAITSGTDWETIFDAFTGEDYTQNIYLDLDELLI